MDSRKLIEQWDMIVAGRWLMTQTKPLKASPCSLERRTEMPEIYTTGWITEVYWN